MNSYGLVIVNQKISSIFPVDKNGEGNGYIVPAPGVKQMNWIPLVKESDVRIFKYKSMNFYAVWSNEKQELLDLVDLLKQYPDVSLSHIFS